MLFRCVVFASVGFNIASKSSSSSLLFRSVVFVLLNNVAPFNDDRVDEVLLLFSPSSGISESDDKESFFFFCLCVSCDDVVALENPDIVPPGVHVLDMLFSGDSLVVCVLVGGLLRFVLDFKKTEKRSLVNRRIRFETKLLYILQLFIKRHTTKTTNTDERTS